MINGGSGSGKSAYAEECIVRMSQGLSRYYLATMQVYGEEGRKKVEPVSYTHLTLPTTPYV